MEATLPRLVRPTVAYPPEIPGEGLVLRPWDMALVRQMGNWKQRGFPYHGFDLGHLADPARAANALASAHEPGPHRHFVAVEEGRAVGRVSINLQDVSGLYLWAVHVPPEEEGRGVCRRMLAALMTWLEDRYPETPFVLSSNTFNEHAHRAYRALGFEVIETRWHYDRELAERLWRVTPADRQPIAHHIRFQLGRWEVRTFVFGRVPGTPMSTGQRPR
ncbi:MAG: GNAT family N-acetyltransferase [Dehalococcoidia bacterium]|nr:GNAT family N-acetyltransferase [Dehalococcoidia bacterium]